MLVGRFDDVLHGGSEVRISSSYIRLQQSQITMPTHMRIEDVNKPGKRPVMILKYASHLKEDNEVWVDWMVGKVDIIPSVWYEVWDEDDTECEEVYTSPKFETLELALEDIPHHVQNARVYIHDSLERIAYIDPASDITYLRPTSDHPENYYVRVRPSPSLDQEHTASDGRTR